RICKVICMSMPVLFIWRQTCWHRCEKSSSNMYIAGPNIIPSGGGHAAAFAPFVGLRLHYYACIVSDPGIAFQTYSSKGEDRCPQRHYLCSPLDELLALPVAEIAAPDCFFFLWVPLRSVNLVEPLMNA